MAIPAWVKIVREPLLYPKTTLALNTPALAVAYLVAELQQADEEQVLAILLDQQQHPLDLVRVSLGSRATALLDPSMVFRAAIVTSASSIILAHNHPGGTLTPSLEDLDITKALVVAGELLGITVLDHIIVTTHNGFLSFAKKGLL